MPKITEAQRDSRRQQILEAAWRCFQREGVQATRIEHILEESGLAPSALYRYFKNKEDIILAAIASSMDGLSRLMHPLLEADDELRPAEFVAAAGSIVRQFSQRSGYNLMSIGVHGWSEAQRNRKIRALLQAHYAAMRAKLVQRAERWQKQKLVKKGAAPADIAHALLSAVLGDVVQATVLDMTDAGATTRGLEGMLG